MRLGVPNWIVDDLNSDSNKLGRGLQYESNSNNDFKSTIAIIGLKLINFWLNSSNFDWILPNFDWKINLKIDKVEKVD